MRRGFGLLMVLSVFVACGDDESQPDQGGQPDTLIVDAGVDAALPDGSAMDLSAAEAAVDSGADLSFDTIHDDAAADAAWPDSTPPDLGPDACVPTTCAAAGKDCGKIFDGCGNVLTCGSCSFPKTCAGGGTANVCGCTAGWKAAPVDSVGSVGMSAAVVTDSKLGTHVVYHDATNSKLKYAYRAAGGTWAASVVLSAGSAVAPSIIVDGSDGLHLAYHDTGAKTLKYTSKASGVSTWSTPETVDSVTSGSVGHGSAIAVDAKGDIHISYSHQKPPASYGYSSANIRYARRAKAGTTWTVEWIEVAGYNQGGRTSIALAGDGTVHLAYGAINGKGTSGKLRHAWRSPGGTWAAETADASAAVMGGWASMALDGTGRLHIAHYDLTNDDLKYSTKPPAGDWSTSSVDTTGNVGEYASLGVDALGGVHIAYWDHSNSDLKYAARKAGASTWSIAKVDTTGSVGSHVALALDDARDVNVAYYDLTNKDLKLAFLPECGGGSCTAATCSAQSASCGAIFDGCGKVLACGSACTYPKTCGGGTAANACGCTAAWTHGPVDSPGTTGQDTAVATDSSNGVHVCYYDSSNSALRYAHRPAGGSWSAVTVDASGTVGRYCSIAVDAGGKVHISYYDKSNNSLNYASKAAGGAWAIKELEKPSTGSNGSFTSLVVDGAGVVHISYSRQVPPASYGYSSARVRYGTLSTAGVWSSVEVQNAGYSVGGSTSLVVDSSGGIHIAYGGVNGKGTAGTLRYAYKPKAGTWTIATASSSAPVVGLYAAMVMDPLDGIHITHYDASNQDLKHTTKPSSGSWSTSTVDSAGSVGLYTGLVADKVGGLHVSYFDNSNKNLKYASKKLNGSWTAVNVDSDNVGQYTALTQDALGNLHLTYYSLGYYDLMYAMLPICP